MNYNMLFTLAGGLGLFLYGMKMMGDGLEKAAGHKLKDLLEALTTNRIMGILVGTVVTAIIQSSSAVTVMIVGFVNAGIMTLAQATGVIMGANIGTTITGQLIAFNLSDVAPIIVFIGVGLIFFSKKAKMKRLGEIVTGFGILFLGLSMMSSSMKPLGNDPKFQEMVVKFKNPIWGLLTGILMTAVLQSSSASMGILQALAIQGAIGLDSAIFVLFGQNIGTCITAIMASVGTSVTAKRAAIIHLLFNILGTLLFTILILVGIPYVPFVESFTPNNKARQIANAHTLFNVLNTVLMFPLAGTLVNMSKKLVPGKEKDIDTMHLMYLDKRILETPAIAVAQISKETGRMADLAKQNVAIAMKAFFERDEQLIEEVNKREEIIDFLSEEITNYLIMVNDLPIADADSAFVAKLFHVVNDIERIGDHAQNIAEYAQYVIENDVSFSDMAQEELVEMENLVLSALEDAVVAIKTRDKDIARRVEPQEQAIDDLEIKLRNGHIERLNAQKCSVSSGVIFLDIVTNLERIGDHACNLADSVLG